MMLLIRALAVIALVVLAVTPPHVHGASPEVMHGVAADHHHHHGHEHDGAHDHEDPGTQLCCASVSLHCGSPALAGESGWTPAEPLAIGVNRKLDDCVRGASSLPEFEPPPPRI